MTKTKTNTANATNQLVIIAGYHARQFNSVAFSPDGTTLASGSFDNTVKLWEVKSGKLIRTLEGHNRSVLSVAFSPDGTTLATGSFDYTVKLWEVKSGKLIRTLERQTGSVRSIAFSPDSMRLASTSDDKTIKLWEVKSGKLTHTLEGHRASVRSVAFSSDSMRLASASDDNAIKLWEVKSGKLTHTLEGHRASVRSVAFSSDGMRLASTSNDKTIKLWEVKSGKLTHTLEGHNRSVLSVAFSPDGTTLASGSFDNTVKLWEVKSGKLTHTLEGHRASVLSVAFSPDSMTLTSASDDETIKLWEVKSGKLIRALEGQTGSVRSVAFSPDGMTLASASDDNAIKLWEVKSGKLTHTLEGHRASVLSVAFSPNGTTLASASDDNAIKLWEVKSGKLTHTLEGHRASVLSVAFSPDSMRLASASDDETIKLWEVKSGKLIRTLEGHRASVRSVAFSPDGMTLASASDDETIKLWEIKIIRTLEGHRASVRSVAFSPDGMTLASASDDETIKLWEVKSGKLIRTLEGHRASVRSVAFSPDGMTLASASDDETIKLWDTGTGMEWTTYRKISLTHYFLSVSFSPIQQIAVYLGLIRLGEPNIIIRIAEPVTTTYADSKVQWSYASAKIVLIGESNAGKSCLALRMAQDRYEEQGTTHGMKFWPMPPEKLCPEAVAQEGENREIIIWDLGGQEEYKLVHQLFLHDTNLALFLFDPTRDTTFEDVREWNLRLEKQLRGRQAIKFLVGTKLDQGDEVIDRDEINRLLKDCGFRGYYPTSAQTPLGIQELGRVISEAIDWEGLSKTTRPEFFQRIREAVNEHQQNGEVVLLYSKLEAQMRQQQPEQFDSDALNTVIGQLAGQGIIVETRLASGERVLALQIGYIEIYAGSLIFAARDNPRGVPAIEELALTQGRIELPRIEASERLDAIKERVMLECVVQLLIEHGICLRHEGLLIFPAMFKQIEPDDEVKAAHTVSLYYDFSGAIDNIWSSLVVRLALSERFGRVRMWKDRAEYDSPEQGVCGLQKKDRKRGLAHLDLLFSQNTSKVTQDLFTTFVEDHLQKEGVKIKEVLEMDCHSCSYRFDEAVVRERISDSQDDIGCPKCDSRCLINKGAEKTRTDNPEVQREFFALKTKVEGRQKEEVKEAKQAFAEQSKFAMQKKSSDDTPIRILHLSDLHWGEDKEEMAKTSVIPLIRDITQGEYLGFKQLDYLVVSGDLTNRATEKEFETVHTFLSELITRFKLSAERCFIVPGNHDLNWDIKVYDWTPERQVDAAKAKEKGYIKQGDGYLIRDDKAYPERFKNFAKFYKNFTQRDYLLKPDLQSLSSLFEDTRIQFLMLNSAWEIDEFNRDRSSINYNALQYGLDEANKKIVEAKEAKRLAKDAEVLRLAILHHPATGNEKITKDEFLEHLRQEKVTLCLHGHIHEDRADLIAHTHKQQVYSVGAGSFGAIAKHRPESTPNLYNLLEVWRDHSNIRVHTRHKKKKDGAWEAWYNWDNPAGKGKLPYYDIKLK